MTKDLFHVGIGKLGAAKRWNKRYEILAELSKYTTKEEQNYLLNCLTKHLETFYRVMQAIKQQNGN